MSHLSQPLRKGRGQTEALTARLRHTAERQGSKLERGRRTGLLVAVGKRFVEIEGGTYGGLLSIELFTTVLPLMILSFAYFSGFASDASIGTMFVRQLGLSGSSEHAVRAAFGTSDALRSSWTVLGLAGWTIWGIPMAITVAGMFARAWRREPFRIIGRLWRGLAWFLLYLVLLIVRERIAYGLSVTSAPHAAFVASSLVPSWIFWSLTPVLLVRDGGRGWRFLLTAGLAGMVIDGLILGFGLRLVFPSMLAGWTVFGPIGVAMATMTWCGFIGYAWVCIACFSGVLWERSAPPQTVLSAEAA
jgi:hypothetical protein